MPLQCTQLVGLIELEEGASIQDCWEASSDWTTIPSLVGRYPQANAFAAEGMAEAQVIEADSLQLRCDLETAYAEILAELGR